MRNVLSIALALAVMPAIAHGDKPDCALVTSALQEVAAVRGISPASPVPCAIATRPEVERFLRESISEKFPAKKLEMEQVVYRAIGVVPDEYDYVHGVIEFYLSQLGGYYDADTKTFVMADWLPAELQRSVAQHELAHALQDQRHGLNNFLNPTSDNGDELMAFASLVEGDATAVMKDLELARRKRPALAQSPDSGAIAGEQAEELAAAVKPSSAPAALQAIVLFPYTYGFRFVHALLRHGGYGAVDAAFTQPPRSTHEILNPQEFLAKSFVADDPAIEELRAHAPGLEAEYSDVIGEFSIRVILEASGGASGKARSAKASEGWRGDRVGVFKPKDGTRLIVWQSEWRSDVDAQEFLSAYRALMKERYGVLVHDARTQLSSTKEAALEGRGSTALVRIWAAAPYVPST